MHNNKAKKAYELFRDGISLSDIAARLNVSAATVRSWKKRHKWTDAYGEKTAKDATRKRNAAESCNATREKGEGKTGRPPAVNEDGTRKYDIAAMIQIIRTYTNQCLNTAKGFPILKECCLLNDWDYDYVMQLQRQHPDLSQSIKRLLAQKEIRLEKLGSVGAIDKTVAIFSLKQLGWRDRVEVAEAEPKGDIADELDKHYAKRKSDTNR